jgi:esterase
MLNHDTVTAPDTAPSRWLYVLHGIYGAGRNWASVMRRVVKQRPEWGVVLIDLREHGGSRGQPPPHTVHAAAADLVELAEGSGLTPSAVLGHSFGGKVALLFAGREDEAAQGLRQVWVVDSTPEAREPGGSAWSMLSLVRSMPAQFNTRDELVAALVAHGMQRPVAQWMATNLEAGDDGAYRWRFDLDALEALLHSFFETDAWNVVERPRDGLQVHMIRAEESSVLSGDALARVETATSNGSTFLHRVAGGHWVNAENPQAIEELLVQMLPAPGSGAGDAGNTEATTE